MPNRLPTRTIVTAATAALLGLALMAHCPSSGRWGGANTLSAAEPGDDQLPPAAEGSIDFATQIKPLLAARCQECHGGGRHRGDFRLDTRELLLEGGASGAAVVPGDSAASYLIELVAGVDADLRMPLKSEPLSDEQVGLLRAWIDEGLPWEEGFRFGPDPAERPLALVRPELPKLPGAAEGAEGASPHPIDALLAGYFATHEVDMPVPLDDARLARRVWLDVVGLLPPPEAIEAFVSDTRPDKRARLIDELLADRHRYAQHWISLWNDMLRNDYRGTGYIDGGRTQITAWLYESLVENRPYDELVRQLIDPPPGAEGFVKGIVWRGVVNASQRPEIQAAQNIAQVFLGINLKCASCHDSFINDWTLKDAYGLAAVFADQPLEIHHCDMPTGEMAEVRFLYPELGSIDPAAPRRERQRQLAELITHEENGRLARTIVNRLWEKLMGRGLIEPVDDMDAAPWHADLLEFLAADLVDHGYDLKHTLRRIATSQAYQRAAVGADDPSADAEWVFRGPLVRRMSAEQFTDAVSALTGVWQTAPAGAFEGAFQDVVAPATQHDDAAHHPAAAAPAAHGPGSLHGRVLFASGPIRQGGVSIDVDVTGVRTLWLVVTEGSDGRDYDWANWGQPQLSGPEGTSRLTDLPWRSASTGYGKVLVDKNVVEKPLSIGGRPQPFGIGTHAASVIVYELPAGTTRFTATAGPDDGALEASPGGHEIEFFVMADVPIRAAQVAADPLTVAMGRPNREQVVTRRPASATTLEALELTNGATLDAMLQAGAQRWLATAREPLDLVRELYRTALGRAPSAQEAAIATELVGQPPAEAGVEDLLWILAMHPEFQLLP